APRRRHGRHDVRQPDPGLLHPGGELAARLGAVDHHADRHPRAGHRRAPDRGPATTPGARVTNLAASRPRRLRLPVMRGYYWLLIGLLYLPIALLFIFSINANTTLSFPLKGFTLAWYAKLFATPALIHAVVNSLIVAVTS